MLILATVTRPPISAAISSKAGAIILQGPHHSAQKSTRKGPEAFKTSCSKVPSLVALVLMETYPCDDDAPVPAGSGLILRSWIKCRERRWEASRRVTRQQRIAELHQTGLIRPDQIAANLPTGIDPGQQGTVSRHLPEVECRHVLGPQRRWALALVVDQPDRLVFYQKAIHLPRDHLRPRRRLHQTGERALGAAARPEQRRQLRRRQHAQHLAENLFLLIRRPVVQRAGQEAPAGGITRGRLECRQRLPQAVDEEAAAAPSAGIRSAR